LNHGVVNRQGGLIDHQGGVARRCVRENDLPWTFPDAAMLDEPVSNDITNNRQDECQGEMLNGIIGAHYGNQTLGVVSQCQEEEIEREEGRSATDEKENEKENEKEVRAAFVRFRRGKRGPAFARKLRAAQDKHEERFDFGRATG
jgi:hypothetical protein